MSACLVEMNPAAPSDRKKLEHDVYDAASRSVELPLHSIPASLVLAEEPQQYDESQTRVKRYEIDFAGKGCASSRGFVLKNFFSAAECSALVAATEDVGYNQHSDVKNEYPEDYRSNSRLIVFEHKIAAAIWSRLLPHLRENDVANLTPVGFATQGIWLPIRVNECLLFSRYEAGQFFKPHNDGMYQSFEGDCSIYTVTIYLNDDYEGGRVKFLKGTAADHTQVHVFQPERGAALVFNHDTLHEGEQVVKGSKYILRTSIMFRRVQDLSDPLQSWQKTRDWKRMYDMFASFTDLQNEKDPAKFTARFLAAQTIQIQNGRSVHYWEPLPLPIDLFREIFNFLDVETLVKMFMVSQSAKQASRSGRVWKTRLIEEAGTTVNQLLAQDRMLDRADPALVDWFPVYKRLYRHKTTFDPLAAYITATTIFYRTMESAAMQTGPSLSARGSYPWDCSFGWWRATSDSRVGSAWIYSSRVNTLHINCLLKTAARAAGVPIQNLPSRAIVLVVQPIFGIGWRSTNYDINRPEDWTTVRELSGDMRTRWKIAALGIVTTVKATLIHANYRDALVVTSQRVAKAPGQCQIRIYVCADLKVTTTVEKTIQRRDISSFLELELPQIASKHSKKRVAFLTDVDPLSAAIDWGHDGLDQSYSEVICDILPGHIEDFQRSSACASARLEVATACPSDLVNVAMQMACKDEYNDIWVTKLPAFVKFKKLNVKPDEAFGYHY